MKSTYHEVIEEDSEPGGQWTRTVKFLPNVPLWPSAEYSSMPTWSNYPNHVQEEKDILPLEHFKFVSLSSTENFRHFAQADFFLFRFFSTMGLCSWEYCELPGCLLYLICEEGPKHRLTQVSTKRVPRATRRLLHLTGQLFLLFWGLNSGPWTCCANNVAVSCTSYSSAFILLDLVLLH